MAARQGLEPQYPGPKPGVLPLDDRAIIVYVFMRVLVSLHSIPYYVNPNTQDHFIT